MAGPCHLSLPLFSRLLEIRNTSRLGRDEAASDTVLFIDIFCVLLVRGRAGAGAPCDGIGNRWWLVEVA